MNDSERRDAHDSERDPPALVLGAHLAALASGAAALAYEVVWTRRLAFVLGATIHAVSAVLGAYMAGLALGSILASRVQPTRRRSMLAYAGVELAIAVTAWLVSRGLPHVRALERWLHAGEQAAASLAAAHFVIAFVCVGVPATLMGATLPLLLRAMTATTRPARVAGLYAANTAGAVLGAVFTGFVLLPNLGVSRTERAAVATNVLAAAVALAAARFARSTDRSPHSRAEPRAPHALASLRRTLLLGAFATGVTLLACEVLWMRALAFAYSWLNNSTYTFSAMVAVVLFATAIGAAMMSRMTSRVQNGLATYGALLSVAGISVALSSYLVTRRGAAPFGAAVDLAGHMNVARAIANVFAETAVVVAVPAAILGAAFPLGVRALAETNPGLRSPFERFLAINTVGAIVGSLGAPFVLVPLVGVVRSILLLATLLSLLAVLIAARSGARRTRVNRGLPALAVTACAASFVFAPHYRLRADDAPIVHYEEGATATIAVARAHDGYLRLDVDGVPVAGTSATMLTDQKSLAHYPVALASNPRRVLTVGFGSGGTSHSLLLHDAIERVRAVEIAPEVLRAAPVLHASNHGVLQRGDRRFGVVLDDARAYLARTAERYDVIATDCTDLRYRSNANLYDAEYFAACRERLRPGGVVAVWLPLGGLSRQMFRVALRTFADVFADYAVFWPNGVPSHYVILTGWRDRGAVQWGRIRERLSPHAVRADLREISLDDPLRVLSTLIADAGSLRAAIASADVNREDRPVLEFHAPLSGYSPTAAVENLEFLIEHRVDPSLRLEAPLPEPLALRLSAMRRALPVLARAHAADLASDRALALRLYLDALAIAPDDGAVRRNALLARDALFARPEDPWAGPILCRAEGVLGDRGRARACFDALRSVDEPEIRAASEQWREELRSARP